MFLGGSPIVGLGPPYPDPDPSVLPQTLRRPGAAPVA
jgi:hypothetical protein